MPFTIVLTWYIFFLNSISLFVYCYRYSVKQLELILFQMNINIILLNILNLNTL